VFAAAVVAEVKAIACELPTTRGVPIGRWSLAELRTEVIASGLLAAVSTATVRRWLCQDAIKPWQHRSWVFPRDPDFAAKAARVLDLYEGSFEGAELGVGEYVISADEKTSIQARCRCHPTLPPGPRPGSCGSSTSTSVAAHWPIWRPGTCTTRACSAAANPRPGSTRSGGWSPRS
jgi:hypothetical protein